MAYKCKYCDKWLPSSEKRDAHVSRCKPCSDFLDIIKGKAWISENLNMHTSTMRLYVIPADVRVHWKAYDLSEPYIRGIVIYTDGSGADDIYPGIAIETLRKYYYRENKYGYILREATPKEIEMFQTAYSERMRNAINQALYPSV